MRSLLHLTRRWLQRRKVLKEINETTGLLNDGYGGDWYFCEKTGRYRDRLSPRSMTVERVR